MRDKFIEIYLSNIKRRGSEELLTWLDKTDFFSAPSSTRFHCSYEGGLCEHSINVYEELRRLLKAYPEIEVPNETVAIVSLLHDVCKIGTYKTELRNKKENGVWVQVPFYTFKEDFSFGGHGSKSLFLVQRFMPLTETEAVAINCHMGSFGQPIGDYSLGSAYEQFPIAWLLHVADESATFIKEK